MIDEDLTAAELRWWNELKAVLRRMPKNVELHARAYGRLGIARAGSGQKSSDRYGNADHFSETEIESVAVPRLDGRDSQL